MQVAMGRANAMEEQHRQEVDDLIVRIDQALERSREVRRRTSRTAEEAPREIRAALSRLRAELRRVSYY